MPVRPVRAHEESGRGSAGAAGHEKPHMRKHPPQPELAIRVGFAGVRNNFDPDLPGLRENLATVLKLVAETVHSYRGDHKDLFDLRKPTRLIFVCSLSAGADLFAASLAVEHGFELQIVLAYPQEKFAASNFVHPEDLNTFKQLLNHRATSAVLELDGSSTETETYDVAGTVLVGHSDVLLAMWDQSYNDLPGGTADSVRKAVASGVPVVAFSSSEEQVPKLLYQACDAGNIIELRDVLYSLLSYGLEESEGQCEQPEADKKFDPAAEQRFLADYYQERERRIDWSLPYSLLISLLRMHWSVRLRLPYYERQAEQNWQPLPGERWKDNARGYFRPIDGWADGLAVFYSNWMRGVVASSLIGGAAIIGATLGIRLFRNHPSPPLLELSPILLVVLIVFSRLRGVQRRWMEYRLLSELVRNYALAAVIGGLDMDHHGFHTRQAFARSWVVFYYQAIVRSFGVCRAVFDDSYLLDFKHLLSERIRGQIRYHQIQQEKCTTLHRRIRIIGLITFSLTLLAPLLQVASEKTWLSLTALAHKFELLDLAAYVAVILSAAIAGFAAQENFARLAQVSFIIKKQLTELLTRVERAKVRSDELRKLTGEAIGITMQEHADWLLLSSLREIEP